MEEYLLGSINRTKTRGAGSRSCVRPLLLLVLLLLSGGCGLLAGPEAVVQDGQVDLSAWNFDTQGPVTLRGMWRFAWSKDDPAFARPGYDDSGWDTIDSQRGFNNKVGTRHGHAWMRLRVKLPPGSAEQSQLALDMLPFSSCSELYVDGRRLFANGRVDTTGQRQHLPNMMPHLLPLKLKPGQQEMVIALRGANYDRIIGGMTESPRLGRLEILRDQRWRKDLLDTIIVGIYILLVLYHLFFWFYRKEDLSSLYFAAWCICIFMRMTSLNGFYERTFPDIDIFTLRLKFEYMGPALAMFTPSFYAVLYPQEFHKRFLKYFNIAAVVEFVFPIFLPLSAFSVVLPTYQKVIGVSLIITCAFITLPLINAVVRKRQGAVLVICGWLPICFGAMNDLAFDWALPTIGNRVQYLGLIFVILNAVVLAIRSAHAFRTAEHLSENLQNEVEAKTEELANKNLQLQDLDRQKTLFFQNISHEFRTPLTLTLGPLQAALDAEPGKYTPPSREQCEMMLRNSERLLLLINQLLDLSKLEAGKMKLKVREVDLVNQLSLISGSFESLAARKGIHFDMVSEEDRLEIYFDPEKMEKVFYNLLSNAFKFTGQGGKIRIKMSRTDSEALVRFKDTGKGIPKEDLPYIFERFRQVDGSSTRDYEGTGIGLSLVKEYVDLHQGQVKVQSELDLGTEFLLTLKLGKDHFNPEDLSEQPMAEAGLILRTAELIDAPADEETDTPAEEPREEDKPRSEESILVVEDNRDMRAYIMQTLRGHFHLREAADGEEGLAQALEHRPDLILTDVMMPKMDGYALIRALSEREETRQIPVIVLTAKASEDMKVEGLREGAHDFLSKPFNPKELTARITNLVTLLRKEKEIDRLNREMREKLLNRYLPPPLVEQVLKGEASLEEKPKTMPVTILFTDLVNFTRWSSDLRAREMSELLNEHLDAMVEVVFRHGGTIDKFIGDSVMVIFGAPVPLSAERQVIQASACAVAMQKEMKRLSRGWQDSGNQSMQMRIGIHHGPVVVGHFGNQRRMDFTAMGPTVNMASRVESSCEAGEVFVSGEVCDYLPRRTFEKVGSFTLKNISGETTLYRLMPDARWEEFIQQDS